MDLQGPDFSDSWNPISLILGTRIGSLKNPKKTCTNVSLKLFKKMYTA